MSVLMAVICILTLVNSAIQGAPCTQQQEVRHEKTPDVEPELPAQGPEGEPG